MGLKFGEKIDVIKAPIRVVSLKREPLSALLADEQYGLSECAKEGFPNLTVEQFIQMFCESHKGCTPDTPLTRIEFSYEVNPND